MKLFIRFPNGYVKIIEVDPSSDTVKKIQKTFNLDDEIPIAFKGAEIQHDNRNFQELGVKENENIYLLGKSGR